jgi:hypothetical protein
MAYAYYPLYGRDYQFDPVPVFDDGGAWAPLHERDTAQGRWWDVIHHQQQRWGDPGDLSGLVESLEALQIDYVFTTTYGNDFWPPNGQAQVLAESDRVRAVYRDGANTIWRISRSASR